MTSWIVILACISGLFFWKTNLTKFSRSYLSEKGQKAVTTAPEKHNNEGKGKKREEEERRSREKSNGCTLGFYNGYFVDSFWPKETV